MAHVRLMACTFHVAFGLFQDKPFSEIESDGISPWLKQLQETQVQLQHMFWCGWRLLLAKYTGWLS